jgi:hypothetical protein
LGTVCALLSKLALESSRTTIGEALRIPGLNATGLYGTTGTATSVQTGRLLSHRLLRCAVAGAIFRNSAGNGSSKELELEHATLQRDAALEREALEHRSALREEALARRALADSEAQLELADRIRRSTLLQHQQGVASLSDIVLADQAFWNAQQNTITPWWTCAKPAGTGAHHRVTAANTTPMKRWMMRIALGALVVLTVRLASTSASCRSAYTAMKSAPVHVGVDTVRQALLGKAPGTVVRWKPRTIAAMAEVPGRVVALE